jgi:serine/threonine protein kinase
MPASIDRLGDALSGRYAIQREIGAGGMAVVYLAEDLKHRRSVAIKVLGNARTKGSHPRWIALRSTDIVSSPASRAACPPVETDSPPNATAPELTPAARGSPRRIRI